MTVEKQIILRMDGAYAVASMVCAGRRKLLVATEQQGSCWEFDLETMQKQQVWNGPGGTMAFADTASADGSMLAVQNFFPVFDSKHAVAIRATRHENGWDIRNVINLPYLHRMDAIETDCGKYFIGCTLCSSKQSTDDWSDAGKVWVGRFSADGFKVENLHPLIEGLTKNHGYFHNHSMDPFHSWIGCENGVYRITCPTLGRTDWQVDKLSDEPVGDIALCDIDEDGEPEMLTIQPFHGESVSVRKLVQGRCETIWQYEEKGLLGHVAWGGQLFGKPAFLFGFREGRRQLVLLSRQAGKLCTTEIDAGDGPANLCVIHHGAEEKLLVANLAIGEVALYTLKDASGR